MREAVILDIDEVDSTENTAESTSLAWYLIDSSLILILAICVIGLIGITAVGIPWWWG